MKLSLIIAVVTHAHDDRIGGIGCLKRKYISVYALESTTMEAKRLNLPRPDIIFKDSLSLNFAGMQVLLVDPGPGHTNDNMIVWIPVERVLYGGCFIRDEKATDLGNLKEADPQAWLESIEKVSSRFAEAVYVIPGHGRPGGLNLIQHTMELLKQYNATEH
jgi:metallo-beta-lactamase class B